MFPHVFGAAAGDSKVVGRRDELDMLLQGILRRILFSNVLTSGMSGFQQVGTSQRRFARLEKKRGGVIVQDLPSANLGERWQTSSIIEGDIIVLSLDEHTPTNTSPREVAVSIFPEVEEGWIRNLRKPPTSRWLPPPDSSIAGSGETEAKMRTIGIANSNR